MYGTGIVEEAIAKKTAADEEKEKSGWLRLEDFIGNVSAELGIRHKNSRAMMEVLSGIWLPVGYTEKEGVNMGIISYVPGEKGEQEG